MSGGEQCQVGSVGLCTVVNVPRGRDMRLFAFFELTGRVAVDSVHVHTKSYT